VSKTYHPSGIITITIAFQGTIYVTVLEGGSENPLLDSRFPDISGKGRGYQLQSYNDGIEGWPGLRKVSIWQTVSALEQEFKDRVSRLAQAKADLAETSATDSSSSVARGDKMGRGEDGEFGSTAKAVMSESGPESVVNEISLDSASLEEKHLGSPTLSRAESATVDTFVVATETSVAEGRAESKDAVPDDDTDLSLSLAEDKRADSKTAISFSDNRVPMSISVARPHHLPKMDDALSTRLSDISKNISAELQSEEGELPWDATGKPVGRKKKKKSKKEKKSLGGGAGTDIEDSEFLRNEIEKVTAGGESLSTAAEEK